MGSGGGSQWGHTSFLVRQKKLFHSCDLDLDLITLIYELKQDIRIAKMYVPGQGIRAISVHFRDTDRA